MNGPALPSRRFKEAYISETVDLISRWSSQGDRSIQGALITVGFDSFGGGDTLAGSACRVKGVKISP